MFALPPAQWTHSFGDQNIQGSRDITVDGAGNVYFVGYSNGGSVDPGGGAISGSTVFGYLAKYDSEGLFKWSRPFVSDLPIDVRAVAMDPNGNVVVAGEYYGIADFGGGGIGSNLNIESVFIARYDPDGNHLMSRYYGGKDALAYGSALAIDSNGNIVVAGLFRGTIDFGGGPLTSVGSAPAYAGQPPSDAYVAKLDANGNHVWSKRYGGTGICWARALGIGAGDAVIVGGDFADVLDMGSGTWTALDPDAFLLKLDSNGNHVWSKRFGGYAEQYLYSMDVATSGEERIAIAGQFAYFTDFGGPIVKGNGTSCTPYLNGDYDYTFQPTSYVALLDGNGAHLWSKGSDVCETGDTGFAAGVAIDKNGSVLVTGWLNGSVPFGGAQPSGVDDAFIARIGADGTYLGSQGFGDASLQQGTAIDGGPSGEVVCCGSYRGTVDFGSGPITSAGSDDVFLVKFGETLTPTLVQSFAAVWNGDGVELRWRLWSDEQPQSFAILRDTGNDAPRMIASGALVGDTQAYVDVNVTAGKTYRYQLVITTASGSTIRSPEATARIPKRLTSLQQNHPNPFTPRTTIEYNLGEETTVALDVFDVHGALVRRIDQGRQAAGPHRLDWDGRDASGRAVPGGIYFYRLVGPRLSEARKMVLVR